MRSHPFRNTASLISGTGSLLWLCLALCISTPSAFSQDYWANLRNRPSTLGLEGGIDTLQTPGFVLRLVRKSQTVAGLSPAVSRESTGLMRCFRIRARSSAVRLPESM